MVHRLRWNRLPALSRGAKRLRIAGILRIKPCLIVLLHLLCGESLGLGVPNVRLLEVTNTISAPADEDQTQDDNERN